MILVECFDYAGRHFYGPIADAEWIICNSVDWKRIRPGAFQWSGSGLIAETAGWSFIPDQTSIAYGPYECLLGALERADAYWHTALKHR